MDVKKLGKSIVKYRTEAGLTQDELSDQAHLSYSTISKLEQGVIKSPSLQSIVSIAEVLKIDLDDLVKHKGSSKSKIKFVYVDMNGVLVRFFQRGFVSLAAETGASAELIETTFWHYNDPINRGEMTMAEFNKAMADRLGVKKINWKKHYLEAVESIMPSYKCLKQLKKMNIKIGLLTNTSPGFISALQKQGLLPNVKFDVIIDSSEVKTIKPEPKIYKIAQKQAKVEPNQILFVDDSRINLVAAERLGWKVLWFDAYRPEESVKRIIESLNNPS